MEVTSKWYRREAEVKSKWNLRETEVKSKWSPSKIEVKSKWHWSEINMNSKWNRSAIEVKPKWDRSETEVKSKWNRSETEAKSKWHRSEIPPSPHSSYPTFAGFIGISNCLRSTRHRALLLFRARVREAKIDVWVHVNTHVTSTCGGPLQSGFWIVWKTHWMCTCIGSTCKD